MTPTTMIAEQTLAGVLFAEKADAEESADRDADFASWCDVVDGRGDECGENENVGER
jgi:hypothetical protein